MAVFQVLEARPLYPARLWAESAEVDPTLDLSSQRISRLMEELGREEDRRLRFLGSWIEKQGDLRGIFFDITSLSSYSKLIEEIEADFRLDGRAKSPTMPWVVMVRRKGGDLSAGQKAGTRNPDRGLNYF